MMKPIILHLLQNLLEMYEKAKDDMNKRGVINDFTQIFLDLVLHKLNKVGPEQKKDKTDKRAIKQISNRPFYQQLANEFS